MPLRLVLILLFLLQFSIAKAAEESLNLDTETVVQPLAPQKTIKFNLMGRIDLTYEYGNPNTTTDPQGQSRSQLENYHMLVFIKAKASEKTSVMGEIAKQKFFFVDYSVCSLANVVFGKILVPFGDNRKYHHYYGGLQGYGANGVMFPNVWSEPGLNIAWHTSIGEFDTYVVNSIAATSELVDPSLQTGSNQYQALGLRYSGSVAKGLNFVLSAYQGEYWKNRGITLLGADFYSDYGALDWGFFQYLRFALGRADALIINAPVSNNFDKRGDYLEIATNFLPTGELLLRYGTYIDNTHLESNKDVHNINLGYSFSVDVIRVLIEHQRNMEAINEIENDVNRVMASVDF